ncbi:MAG: dihydrolipoamide acetyltransferase family protein [Gammaproteobacteria bacterium]
MSIFKLPDLGEGLPDAEINEWYVKEGDTVSLDQPLVSMETAKAVVDVPAPQAGKIVKLYGKPGDIIKTGAPLIEFASDITTTSISQPSNDTGTVVGNITVGQETVIETATIAPRNTATRNTQASIKTTPALRALAKKFNVDLATVVATGPNQTITKVDIERTANELTQQGEFEPLRGVRRAMATTMSQSHAEVVPVTLVDDANLHAWAANTDITARIIRALVTGCRTEPALNAWYNTQLSSRRLLETIDLGLAIDTTDGLFVPVIRDVAALSSNEIRQRINHLKELVKTRDIPAEQLRGASITLSNFGNFAGRYANPIVVPPTVAILGTGRIRDEVVAYNNEMAIHKILPLSLTFDHRAVTGGEATRFLAAVINDLQQEQ